ncbi:hypothetical protein ADL29_06180 [Streptomyces chattanoogensis]|uniref:Uncharacterized protein n=2 Tax=Streptomyces chattanoogensis TaxID=66876 RepID=A0A0N0Y0Y6_9ACTN|nr:hypothetical protein ADL29_06180 [Streptomyces chattanoogensis]
MIFESLLRWLIPGRGQHRAPLNEPTTGATWRVAAPSPQRRHLVCVRRVPSALHLMCSADARAVRPYVLTPEEWAERRAVHARRAALAADVRRLNRWSSSGGGRL